MEETAKPKLTLATLLTTLQAGDESLSSLTIEESEQLVSDLKDKVDSYRYIDQKFDLEIERLTTNITEMQAVKASMVANKARLRELMAFHMQNNGFSKLPGTLYQVSLIKKKDVKLAVLPEPGPDMYRTYPGLVKRTYEWDNKVLKDCIKKDEVGTFKDFGAIIEKVHVQFSVKKELKND